MESAVNYNNFLTISYTICFTFVYTSTVKIDATRSVFYLTILLQRSGGLDFTFLTVVKINVYDVLILGAPTAAAVFIELL